MNTSSLNPMSACKWIWLLVSLLSTAACPIQAADRDEDGLDDGLEQTLLNRHLPRMIYQSDERRWPMSASRLVRSSRLRWNSDPDRRFHYNHLVDVISEAEIGTNPLLILRGGDRLPGQPSTQQDYPARNEWYLDINDGVLGGVYPQPDGSAHEGMYGHAVLKDGQILLQYWQLFAFNEAECISDCGDHEADWLQLEVCLDAASPYPLRRIVYHHHGDGNCPPTSLPFAGGRVGQNIIPAIPLPADGVPICYIEGRAHEWWPWISGGEECDFDPTGFGLCFNASHLGNGISYRVPRVENIGERFAPMPGSLDAELILLYNGRWGAWGSECFDHVFEPPDSPVHQNYPGPAKVSRAYVDRATNYADPNGSRYRPVNTLAVAAGKLTSGGVMSVRADAYPEPATLTNQMTIEAWP